MSPTSHDGADTALAGRVRSDFDHQSSEYAEDPAAYMRGLCPVSRADTYGGFYVAVGHKAVVEVGRDPETFYSGRNDQGRSCLGVPAAMNPPYPMSPLEIQGQEFISIRRLLDPLITRRAAADMLPGVQYYADYFLDQVIESGRMELMEDYAAPVPASISIDWYGLSPDLWRFFAKRFGDQQRTTPGTPEFDAAMEGLGEINDLMGAETRKRREQPRDDILSKIANAVLDGEEISEDMATGTAAFVLSGGVNTTAILTAHTLIYLAEHPEHHQRLLEDERFLRSALEEFLRLTTPVLSTARQVTKPTTLAGTELQPGDPVLIGWGAANRDPEVFGPTPDEHDLERWPNRHVAFGVGPHRCVGANLARVMATTMMTTIVRRIPDFRVVESQRSANRSVDNGFATVELEFSPGERVLPTVPLVPQFHTPEPEVKSA